MIELSNPARQTLALPGLTVVAPQGERGEGLLQAGYRSADRLLRRLLLAHLLLVLALAPLRGTWTEALLWGAPVIALGWFVAWKWEGRLAARMAIATSLLLVSALIIHQTGGMIEMHFHIFAILAFLLLYRDWRVPVAGAAVVASHHVLFNVLQTAGSGVMVFEHHTGWAIVAVHAAWVVFEVAILVYMARLLASETAGADALVQLATRMGDGDLMARADHGAGAVGNAVLAVNRGTERLAESVRGVRNRATDVADVRRPLPSPPTT